jgi:caffeoyl-CoA O-methyltransferase
VSRETLALTGKVYDYYAAHSFREAQVLADLRAETHLLGGHASMQIAPEQGAFMAMFASAMDARNVLEIGTFTGYSSLVIALATQAHITCVDVSEEWTTIARKYWAKAGVAGRISLRLDGGQAAIAELLATGRAGSFDLAFIDADKVGYDDYYEGALKLLRAGGVIMIDNVLWGGEIANPAVQDADTLALRKLNDKIMTDTRVDVSMVPIGDGVTLVRKRTP